MALLDDILQQTNKVETIYDSYYKNYKIIDTDTTTGIGRQSKDKTLEDKSNLRFFTDNSNVPIIIGLGVLMLILIKTTKK